MNTPIAKGNTPRVLQDTRKPTETAEQKIARLEAELAKANAKAASKRQLRCKVSAKGAVSLYGLNARWPVTLYGNQWETLAGVMPSILKFVADNQDKLSKPEADSE